MVDTEIILKSLDDAILKCKPKFSSMHTPKQIAKYFGYKYDGLVDKLPVKTILGKENEWLDVWSDEEIEFIDKVHVFKDTKNDCNIFISDNYLDKKTGNLVSDWYKDHMEYRKEHPENFTEPDSPDLTQYINDNQYPLKEFFKDYTDLPEDIKSCISSIVWDMESSAGGQCHALEEGKALIRMYRVESVTFDDGQDIVENPRKTLFHEVSHAFANKIMYDSKEGWDWDIPKCNYLANSKEYKKGRREDKKLNGDKYATWYAESSKDFTEEQADICGAMLLKALSKNDSNYNKRKMVLASTFSKNKDERRISIDDFLKRYPNRVEALNKYMKLEL